MKNMKIRLKSLVEFQIYYLLIVEVLISLFNIPSFVRYLLDVNMLALLLFNLPGKKNWIFGSKYRHVGFYAGAYMFAMIVSGIVNFVPLGQYIWAIRNNIFYMLFFFMCIKYLSGEDVERIMKRIVNLQALNTLFGLYEYFVLELEGDYLGGFFGIEKGCNGYLNIYLCIITAYELCRYFYKKISLVRLLLVVGSSILMATLGELKIFYLELLIIVFLCVLLARKSLKSFFSLSGGAAAAFLGIQALTVINPQAAKFLKSIEKMIEYSSRSDYGNGDIRIARLTAIAQINDWFFGESLWLKLFGYGFGACESSETFNFFHSDFASRYDYLGYRNISAAMIYLEAGLIGLLGMGALFLVIFFYSHKIYGLTRDRKDISLFVQILSILCVINLWYNSAIRRPVAYLTFFALASAFVCVKEVRSTYR